MSSTVNIEITPSEFTQILLGNCLWSLGINILIFLIIEMYRQNINNKCVSSFAWQKNTSHYSLLPAFAGGIGGGGRDRGTAKLPREKTPSNKTVNLSMVKLSELKSNVYNVHFELGIMLAFNLFITWNYIYYVEWF